MNVLLWLIILCPFLGALLLAVLGASMPKKFAGLIGCASIGLSCLFSFVVARQFLAQLPGAVDTTLYPWMNVGGLRVEIALHLDALSLVYVVVVSLVAFLIHTYAAQSMYESEGYSRFFCYMNLFVGFMLVLVLSANLLFLYLGWEGVGLCSFLLIGFYYKEIKNVHAAQKAFIVTRIGDTALIIGLFLLYKHFGTLDMWTILQTAPDKLALGGSVVTLIAFLLIGGAVGKSAQLPLQTWLPDAMAGPTPVSALIHAATMVTAGVYLIARMHVIIAMSPIAQLSVVIIGTVTLIYGAFSALAQDDIKRVLAYSTISQIGYMFLALGVGAWAGAIFHFLTHAFFKSLLFLSAGIIIDALGDEHNILKMGGLKRRLPVAFWTFLIGTASLSGVPLITAGFYSKDAILWASWSSSLGSAWLWGGAIIAALATSAYSFRVVFLTFFGEQKTEVVKLPGSLMKLSVGVLAFFAITVGFLSIPRILGNFDPFRDLISGVLPAMPSAPERSGAGIEKVLFGAAIFVSLLGIFLAYAYFKGKRWQAVGETRLGRVVHSFLLSGWKFNRLYDEVFVKPYIAITYANSADFLDRIFVGLAELTQYAHTQLSRTQTGKLRHYAMGLLVGAIAIAAILMFR